MLDLDAIYVVPFALGPLGEHFCTLFTWYRLLWDWPDYFGFLGVGAGLLWALRRPVRNSLVFLLFLEGKSTILARWRQEAPGRLFRTIPDYSGLAWAGLHCLPSMLDFDAIYVIIALFGPLEA